MTCPICVEGDHNLCAQAEGVIVGRHGGFADKVRAQAASVVPLPQNIDLQSAGPLFCGGIPLRQVGVYGKVVDSGMKYSHRHSDRHGGYGKWGML